MSRAMRRRFARDIVTLRRLETAPNHKLIHVKNGGEFSA